MKRSDVKELRLKVAEQIRERVDKDPEGCDVKLAWAYRELSLMTDADVKQLAEFYARGLA